MKKILPILLLVVALIAVALWHARARRPDDRQADSRSASGSQAQPTDAPENDDEGGTRIDAAHQPGSEEEVALDEEVVEEILLDASEWVRYYGFAEIDKTKQPAVERCKAGVCVTFPRIAAPKASVRRDFAVKVIVDPKTFRLIEIVGATIEEQPVAEATGKPISDKDAIAIATRRVAKYYPALDTEAFKPSVLRSDTAVFVTFPIPPLPPGTAGGDFTAIVTIDAKSMEVLKVLGGR